MRALERGSYSVVPGLHYGTPKELWGFRSERGTGAPLAIAKEFLEANETLLGLKGIRAGLRKAAQIRSLGADHVILRQHHAGAPLHRAYVTVHIGRKDRRVYLVKNRAMPKEFLPEAVKPRLTREQAVRKAMREVEARKADTKTLEVDRVWYPEEDELLFCFKVRLDVLPPGRRRQEWIVFVDARTGRVLSSYDNLAGAGDRSASAWIFDPNPVIALGDHERLLKKDGMPVYEVPDEAYREVTLRDLRGTGYLDGLRVTTAPTGRGRVKVQGGRVRLEANERGFEEVMAYFHIDRAIRYFESLGFRGESAIFEEPLPVDVRGTSEDQSWYSPAKKMLFFGLGGGVNDAEDAETILHEFGHALQDAICSDFGQSPQAAAMGEGFGDYLALSFFADRPERYRHCVMTWDGITGDENDPPCVRKHGHGLTMESFRDGEPEHENGRIWAETLLDVNAALGRKVADMIIVESHFQLDGFTTMARGARAMLDADQNLYGGNHARRLRRIFLARGLAPIQ